MGLGTTALNTNRKQDPSGPPFVAGSANNGLSVDPVTGKFVLGNDVGGALAALLSAREIPMAGFDIRLSGVGNFVIGSNAGLVGRLQVIGAADGVQQLIKLPAGQTITNPFFQVTNAANVPVFEMRAVTVNNLFIGPNVGKTLQTGFGNVGVGCILAATVTCLGAITTGLENTAMGSRSLSATTTGSGNCAFGDASLQSNITGSSSCAIGQDSLSQGTAPSLCVAMGTNAGKGIAGSSNFVRNVMLGAFTFNQVTAGDNNVAIGYGAARCQAGAAAHGIGNVVIGSEALANMAMGTGNILIGYLSHNGSAVGNDVISIGVSNIAQGNNTTLIGNGMTSTVANVAGYGLATQNIILGQTAIAVDNGARLQVNGDFTTADPGSGAGKWKMGTVVAGAVAVDAANYVEVDINGAIVKLIKAV